MPSLRPPAEPDVLQVLDSSFFWYTISRSLEYRSRFFPEMPYLLIGSSLTVFWLLLSGYFNNLLLLFFGAVSVVIALYFHHRIVTKYPLNSPPSIIKRLPGFIRWLIYEVIKANIAVVKNVWFPKTNPISPTVATLPMRQTSSVGRTIFANSITLTPGTVSFDISGNEVKVHAIVEEAIIELQDGEMNQRVADLETTA